MATNNWYYAKDGRQIGPVDQDALRNLVFRGVVLPNDLVWCEGMPQWQPASTIPVIASAGGAPSAMPYASAPTARGYSLNYGGPQSYPQYAGFWLRFVAAFIDGIIVLLGRVVVMFIIDVVLGIALVASHAPAQQIGDAIRSVGNLVGIVIYWLYFALLESSATQATLGKMAVKLRVTDLNGGRISFGRATGRFFGKYVSLLTFLVGYMMAGWTRQKQALHDLMAGTLVVRQA